MKDGLDFRPYFDRYETIVNLADTAFDRVMQEYPDLVACKVKCSECCHALFDLSLVEALYLNSKVMEAYSPEGLAALREKANAADRSIYKIKREAFKAVQAGTPEEEVLERLGQERVRCPLLNEQDLCDLYDYRPITCRLYGMPTAFGGHAHTCGKSGFREGEKYPTVNIDAVYQQLYTISSDLVRDIKSRHVRMADLLVPVSMAILTVYDEKYLGIGPEKEDE